MPDILINDNDPFHIFGFSESRLTNKFPKDFGSVPNYHTPIRKDVEAKLATGLIVYIHQSMKFQIIPSTQLNTYNIECIWFEIFIKGSKPLVVGFLYQNGEEYVEWFDRFDKMMEDAHNYSSEIILLGDFNIDILILHEKWKKYL